MPVKREHAWRLSAGWNDTFLWYAKAVIELKKRDITDRTSWRYLAAMHQFDRDLWIQIGIIDRNTALPPAADTDIAWNQCQHSSFYFLPWHRAYLATLAGPWAEVRDTLNRTLFGWSNYFTYGMRRAAHRGVDRYVYERVRDFLARRHKVAGRGTRRFSFEVVYGELGLLLLECLPPNAPVWALR
jgi:hypothetical protein